ncbi:DUF2336 domain-containing protein [Telmatospirillum siberiense]|uniref:DUF2336 domain-containing protein n=1 Tax=Telmatospirillum siberiense TaxID=382514 RepID=A0A2N3PMS6_9PROT|nr:DUF2336 domain-containing protein [Telmatospirillum siberiense]PKU21708.1 hypothetical protein CWS72_25330 [Telmatospirillum siberiense]
MSPETETPMPEQPVLSYEEARDIAASSDVERRRELAGRADAPPEVLYFLAGDELAEVRRTVAANPRTPAKGNLLLAGDAEHSVRQEVAAKIVQFGHHVGISPDQARSKEIMDEVMARLADDSVVRIRALASNALKEAADVDPAVIGKLARDRQIAVAAPVLQYSPLLSDADLLALIEAGPAEGVLAAIARRRYVDARVSAAIVASSDPPAITHLLKNANINLQEETLDALIDGASAEPSWQEPLVFRRELSEAALDRVVEMAAPHVLDHILSRRDLPPQTASAVAKAIEDSLRHRPGEISIETKPANGMAPSGAAGEISYQPALERMRALRSAGQLDEMAVTVSLLTDHYDDLVAGLAVLADIEVKTVLDIAAAHSARAICSLAWAAGLSPSFALELQMRFGNIAPDEVFQPGEGDRYRLSNEEMAWQLDMFRAGQSKPGP